MQHLRTLVEHFWEKNNNRKQNGEQMPQIVANMISTFSAFHGPELTLYITLHKIQDLFSHF